MDIALPVEKPSQNRQFLFQLSRHPLEYQALSCVVQYRNVLPAHLLQNPVSQAAKTEHVYVQDTALVVQKHQILLGLHGKLIRHNHQKILPGVFSRPPGNLFIQLPALSRPGRAEVKLKAHLIFST